MGLRGFVSFLLLSGLLMKEGHLVVDVFFGGIADKTLRRGSQAPTVLPTRVLVLTGAVIFGGVEIKN